MIEKVEIIIERLDNGITVHWSDKKGEFETERCVALNDSEAQCLGKQVWKDVFNIMDSTFCDKVKMNIEYKTL